jgi:D-tyrosyl-tRNA(Tyr) deacylase
MRVVLQRVRRASVTVDHEIVGEIGPGWLVLLGIAPSDSQTDVAWMSEKIVHLRAFADPTGKMNLSVQDVAGSVLVVSQFTLYGECQKGRRPSFLGAARPEIAIPLYEAFLTSLRSWGVPVAAGRFGADMQVELVNDGPVTLIIDSPNAGGSPTLAELP